MTITVETVLARLDGVRPSRRGWSARCPAHRDRSPSLSVAHRPGGRVLLHCFAGCDYRAVLAALGLSEAAGATGLHAAAVEDAHRLALRLARSQPWTDPLTRAAYRLADAVRAQYQMVDRLRREATALGDTAEAWDRLARAADHERVAFAAEAELDEVRL